ncbi:MAG TPA: glycosyltransferase family 4 protein [Candidatus Sulfotelmatobacter sp.]|nr:glycosyltransferase family 4 protein [Candidatus Sulfotelmatobacter sp.]
MAARLKILQVSSGLDPRTGGTATAAINVALAARRADLAVTLVYPFARAAADRLAPDLARLRDGGVRAVGLPFWRAGGTRAERWAIAPALHGFLAGHAGNFDVVHAHSAWVATSVAAVRAARGADRPIVLMPHESLTGFDMAHGPRLAKRMLRRWYLKRVDRIVVSSELERHDSGLDDDPRALAIPHPVLDETAPAPASGYRPGDGLRVGFLGRLDPKKNLHRLAKALADAPGVRLIIGGAGDDAYRAEVETLIARHGVADRVTWLGFLDAAVKPGFFDSVDVVAMPSAFECFGLVAAEALGAGAPVIVSPTVGVADMIAGADCGVIVPPRADALAACFRRLADGVELSRWRANARRVALELFSFAAHGARLREVYETLVKERALR